MDGQIAKIIEEQLTHSVADSKHKRIPIHQYVQFGWPDRPVMTSGRHLKTSDNTDFDKLNEAATQELYRRFPDAYRDSAYQGKRDGSVLLKQNKLMPGHLAVVNSPCWHGPSTSCDQAVKTSEVLVIKGGASTFLNKSSLNGLKTSFDRFGSSNVILILDDTAPLVYPEARPHLLRAMNELFGRTGQEFPSLVRGIFFAVNEYSRERGETSLILRPLNADGKELGMPFADLIRRIAVDPEAVAYPRRNNEMNRVLAEVSKAVHERIKSHHALQVYSQILEATPVETERRQVSTYDAEEYRAVYNRLLHRDPGVRGQMEMTFDPPADPPSTNQALKSTRVDAEERVTDYGESVRADKDADSKIRAHSSRMAENAVRQAAKDSSEFFKHDAQVLHSYEEIQDLLKKFNPEYQVLSLKLVPKSQ